MIKVPPMVIKTGVYVVAGAATAAGADLWRNVISKRIDNMGKKVNKDNVINVKFRVVKE